MAYYRKNKRRFDPRYFMNERMEEGVDNTGLVGGSLSGSTEQDDGYTRGGDEGSLEEMIPGDPGYPGHTGGPDADYDSYDKKPFPDGAIDLPAIKNASRRISVRLGKSSSPRGAAGDEEEQLANLAYSEEEHEKEQGERHRIRNLPETYDEEAPLEE